MFFHWQSQWREPEERLVCLKDTLIFFLSMLIYLKKTSQDGKFFSSYKNFYCPCLLATAVYFPGKVFVPCVLGEIGWRWAFWSALAGKLNAGLAHRLGVLGGKAGTHTVAGMKFWDLEGERCCWLWGRTQSTRRAIRSCYRAAGCKVHSSSPKWVLHCQICWAVGQRFD